MYKRILSLCLCLFLLTAMSPAALVYGNGETGMPASGDETVSDDQQKPGKTDKDPGNAQHNTGENTAVEDDIKKEEDNKKEEEEVIKKEEVYKLSLNNTLLKFDAKKAEQVRPLSFVITNEGTENASIIVGKTGDQDDAFSVRTPFNGILPLSPGTGVQCSVELHSNLNPGDYKAEITFIDQNCPDKSSLAVLTVTATVWQDDDQEIPGSSAYPPSVSSGNQGRDPQGRPDGDSADEPQADLAGTAAAAKICEGLSADAWYYDSIKYAAEKGVLKGEGPVDSAAYVTRAEAVLMLWRFAGEPESDNSSFIDVDESAEYAAAVGWALKNGIAGGVAENVFSPDAPVTREQLAAVLYRYAKMKGEGFQGMWSFLLDFSDAQEVSEYAYEPMCWMVMQGIILGRNNGRLDPGDYAIKAEISAMLMRYDNLER